jgi:hypothetical protein
VDQYRISRSFKEGGGSKQSSEVVEAHQASRTLCVFASVGKQEHLVVRSHGASHGFSAWGRAIVLAPRLDCVHLFDARSTGTNQMH